MRAGHQPVSRHRGLGLGLRSGLEAGGSDYRGRAEVGPAAMWFHVAKMLREDREGLGLPWQSGQAS